MAGTTTGSSCCAISCCDPITNFAETAWKDVREGVITLKDGIKRSVVYVGVGKFFEYAKLATNSIEGWKKLAGVIIPLAALALETDVESISDPLGTLAAQFETFKLLQGGMAWIGVGDDAFKKEWFFDKIMKNYNKEKYAAIAIDCIANIKRIGLIAVNCLKLVGFGSKLGVIAEVSLKIGSVPVISLILTANTTLSLIGNGLTFYTNYVDDKEVNDKIARFQDEALVTEEKMNALKEKLKALIDESEPSESEVNSSEENSSEVNSSEEQLEETGEVDLEEELSNEEKPEYFANFTYAELKKEIALKKAEKKLTEARKNLNVKREMIGGSEAAIQKAIEAGKDAAEIKVLEDARSALYSACSKVAIEYLACNANFDTLETITGDKFQAYKIDQYHGRLADLDQQLKKTKFDVVCNAVSLVGLGLGLGKAYFGMEAIMNFLDVKESAINITISTVQLLTGSSELGKFFYDEDHKEGRKQLSVAEFASLR